MLIVYLRGLFSRFSEQHEQVQNTPHEHKGHLSHEVIAGAASFEAVKAYNEHCERNGKPVDHATAKALLAGFAGAALDKLIETKGLDFIDKQKAKHEAESQAKEYYEVEHS
ncbi:Putative CipC protein [Source:UniProtKB/TrEMBL;Acc:Q8NKC9] [Rhizopus microsporus]|nr:Putative CipC protein [Source:UniProtKB/TrEMBL;Acc:Q8NKC9] [Rhizopus microsporus]